MRSLKTVLGVLLCLVAQHAFSVDQYSLDLHLKVGLLKEASAPQLFGNDLIFSYKSDNPVRLVGIAFSDENFAIVHPLYRNSFGVFFYVRSVPKAGTDLLYRLIVDGLWTTDPHNPNQVEDGTGVALSQVVIPARAVPVIASPVYQGGGEVQFFFKAPPDRIVYLAGDFNNWDPFTDRLSEIQKGLYTITLRIPAGVHAYYFVSDGMRISDPLNPRVELSADGANLSVFRVP